MTLRDAGTVRVIGIAGTLGTVRDDLTLREVGTVRVVGNAGTLDTVRDDQTLKFILMWIRRKARYGCAL